MRGNLNDYVENSILFEYDVNKGLKVQDYSIETDEVTINSYEIIDMIEVEESNENTKQILFETNFYFEAEGTWTVSLGLENDIFDSNEGSFMINQSAISVQAKLSFTIGFIEINEAFSIEIVEYEGIDINLIDVAENIYYMEEEKFN